MTTLLAANLTKAFSVLITWVNVTIEKKASVPFEVKKLLFANVSTCLRNVTDRRGSRSPSPSPSSPRGGSSRNLSSLGYQQGKSFREFFGQPAMPPGFHACDPEESVKSELIRLANMDSLLAFLREKQSAPPMGGFGTILQKSERL